MCDQQSLRPACAYAQPDQSLCLSLEYSMIVKLLTERHLEFLSITGGCRGPSESTLVKMSNCWKSRALAHYHYYYSLGFEFRAHLMRTNAFKSPEAIVRVKIKTTVISIPPYPVILLISKIFYSIKILPRKRELVAKL